MSESQEFNDSHIPLAYLITFRSYGTWLHGDKRGAVDRAHNRYDMPRIPANQSWQEYNEHLLKRSPVKLNLRKRAAVEEAVRETCLTRNWTLWAINVRSNHVHAIVTASCRPDQVLNAFKANATRRLRKVGCCGDNEKPWVRGGSKKYLWTENQLNNAIAYVMYDQGEPLA